MCRNRIRSSSRCCSDMMRFLLLCSRRHRTMLMKDISKITAVAAHAMTMTIGVDSDEDELVTSVSVLYDI